MALIGAIIAVLGLQVVLTALLGIRHDDRFVRASNLACFVHRLGVEVRLFCSGPA